MNDDDFTTAARTEADRRMRADGLVTQASMVRARGFTVGAVWARDHLARQEPTDAEVEAAAIECVKFLFLTAPERPWEDPEVVEQWEPMARIALRSARAALTSAREARP